MKNSKKKYIYILGLFWGVAVFFPVFSARATDYSSTNFTVKDPIVSQGAGSSASTSFQNIGNIGQPAIGISNSTSFILNSGFLYFPAPTVSSSPTPSGGGGQQGSGGGTGYYQSSSPSLFSQPSPSQPSPPIPVTQPSPLASILRSVSNFISKFFPHPSPPPQLAIPIVPNQKEVPIVFRGVWQLLSAKEIGAFVFAPLPQDVAVLGQKFPTVENAFKAAGVERFSDLNKLQNIALRLPTLTERVGIQPVALKTQPFALPNGVPISDLLPGEKARIPSEIVFARIGKEKIDLPINLTLQQNGSFEKTIRTVVGSTLRLVIKPEYPAKSVKGYLVLKSRTRREETSMREQVPLQNMLASIFFVRPVFAEPAKNAVYRLLAETGGATETVQVQQVVPENTENVTARDIFPFGSLAASTTKVLPASSLPNVTIEERLALAEFEYTPDRDGIYTADVRAPGVDGEYEVITLISYENPRFGVKEISLTAVVDPEGYVFERNGDKETRIPGAVVSLSYLNSATKKYELWPGKDYTQENPQITDVRGTYAFLAPPGIYSISVTAPGYSDYQGKPFQLSENNEIHMNIEMKSSYGFLASIDLKTILLIVLFLLIGYNFYKDKLREIYKGH